MLYNLKWENLKCFEPGSNTELSVPFPTICGNARLNKKQTIFVQSIEQCDEKNQNQSWKSRHFCWSFKTTHDIHSLCIPLLNRKRAWLQNETIRQNKIMARDSTTNVSIQSQRKATIHPPQSHLCCWIHGRQTLEQMLSWVLPHSDKTHLICLPWSVEKKVKHCPYLHVGRYTPQTIITVFLMRVTVD